MKHFPRLEYDMCIVIDINIISAVFSDTHTLHKEFLPVRNWICHGKGKFVYGGSKYENELMACNRNFITILSELTKKRKTVIVDREKVDSFEQAIIKSTAGEGCDDQHIIAIIAVSGCKLICSHDKRAFRFFKKASLYPHNIRRPAIYTRSKNIRLLTDSYIADCCKSS